MTNADLEIAYWRTRLGKSGSLTDLRWEGYGVLGGVGNTLRHREKSVLGNLLGISEPALSSYSINTLRRLYRLSNLGLTEPKGSMADLDSLFWAGTPFTAPPSTPGDVPTGLNLWLKADSIAQADGSTLPSWADSSPAGNTATEATNPPFFYLNIQNGKPAVYFNGTTSKLNSAAPAGSSAQTIIGVLGIVVSGAGNTIRGASVSGGIQFRNNAGTLQIVKQSVGVVGSSSAGAIADTLFHIVTMTYDSVTGAWAIYVDQVLKGSGTNVQALTASTTTPGVGGTQVLNGYLGELAQWSRVLTGTELANISNGLKSKWATP